MRELGVLSQHRIKILFLLLIGIFLIFLIRLGVMQVLYQNNIVTFAQLDQTVKELNIPIIQEVTESFDINLDRYSEVTKEQIINSGETDAGSLSLLDIMYSSCTDGCFGQPVAYIYQNKGYVFYRKENGDNILLDIKKDRDRWIIVKAQIGN